MVFHAPPPAVEMYIVFGSVESVAMPVTRPLTAWRPVVCPLLIGSGPTLNQRSGTFVGAAPRPVPWMTSGMLETVRLPWSCRVAPLATWTLDDGPKAWLFSTVTRPPAMLVLTGTRRRTPPPGRCA